MICSRWLLRRLIQPHKVTNLPPQAFVDLSTNSFADSEGEFTAQLDEEVSTILPRSVGGLSVASGDCAFLVGGLSVADKGSGDWAPANSLGGSFGNRIEALPRIQLL